MSTTEAVFFDLDGTLVDTAPDLIYALNVLLTETGHPKISLENARNHVSAGAAALIQRGLGAKASESLIEQLKPRYLEIYQANLSLHSTLFPGMEDVLHALETYGIKWGIVTNKPTCLAEPLIAQLALSERCCSLICADTTAHKKPHPEPLFEACRRSNVAAENCIYVGDDLRDIQAGNSAGMRTLAAGWGYYLEEHKIEDWPAQALIHSADEILHYV